MTKREVRLIVHFYEDSVRARLRRIAIVATCLLAFGAGEATAHAAGGAVKRPAKASKKALKRAGHDVRVLQRKLGVSADGIFGRQTLRALRRFQRRNDLTVDGIVGPQTLQALGLRTTARRATVRSRRGESAAALLARIAQCESGGDPTAVSPGGRYRGKYQFSRATWRSVGGKGDPAKASEQEQDLRAFALLERQGRSAWPTCSKRRS